MEGTGGEKCGYMRRKGRHVRVWVMTSDVRDLQSIVEKDRKQNGFGPDFDNQRPLHTGLRGFSSGQAGGTLALSGFESHIEEGK